MSGFNIQITAGEGKNDSSIRASGTITRIISDDDINKFGITDGPLKDCVATYFGQRPDDAFLRSPTPWNDLFRTYGWQQTQVTISVASAEILNITTEPVALVSKTFTNDSSEVATFSAKLEDSVSDTLETNWSQSNSVSVSEAIEISAEVLGLGGKSTTTIGYTGTWEKGGSTSKTSTVTSGQDVSVTLAPGKSATAKLSATRGSLLCRVTYQASISGSVAVNYTDPYKGHHYWDLSTTGVMQSGHKPSTLILHQDIKVGYYGSGTVQLVHS